MENKKRERIDLIEVTVTGAGEFSNELEMDKRYSKLTGISLKKQPNADLSLSEFNCDGNTDTFAAGYELVFLQTDVNVSPNERFLLLDMPCDGKKLKIKVADNGLSPVYPFTLKFHLRLEK